MHQSGESTGYKTYVIIDNDFFIMVGFIGGRIVPAQVETLLGYDSIPIADGSFDVNVSCREIRVSQLGNCR